MMAYFPSGETKAPLIGVEAIPSSFTYSHGPSQSPSIPQVSGRARVYRKLHGYVTKWWLAEVASSCLALFLTAVILVFLFFLDGKTYVDSSTHGKGNVYSILSFLNTVTKAAMLMPVASGIAQLRWKWFKRERLLADMESFDDASRGFWGSVKFLFKVPFW